MKRKQFLRKLQQLCKDDDKFFDWKPSRGKGSHGTVYVGDKKTTVQDGELQNDYIGVVLKQLGLDKNAV